MAWVIGILKFIAAAIAVFTTCVFIISCIQAIINPKPVTKDGKVVDANDEARGLFSIIMAISWALVITL